MVTIASKKVLPFSACDALAFASQEWNPCNESHGIRLLVVFRENNKDNQSVDHPNAFLDFDSDKSCAAFIERKAEIMWFDKEKAGWNGDRRHLGEHSPKQQSEEA